LELSPDSRASSQAREISGGRSTRRYFMTDEDSDEDGQRWTPPPRSKQTQKKTKVDTPDPRQLNITRSSSGGRRSAPGSKSRVSFTDLLQESSSDSDADVYLSSTQPRHYLKPPKFNGTSAFETVYAHFENCSKYNRWDRSEQLAHLKAALVDEAGQVLWDSAAETTSSLSKLVRLLKERFGGAAQADKYRMELRGRLRQPKETLQNLHREIRGLMVLAYPDLEAKSREVVACDCFLDSLEDSELKLKMRERNPATLDEALKVALLLEVWAKDAAHARQEVEDQQRYARAQSCVRGRVLSKIADPAG